MATWPTVVAALHPTDILLQLDYGSDFFREETSEPFGRVPEFTLLADGRAFYVDADASPEYEHQQTMVVQLTPAQVRDLMRHMLDLGLEQLESYTDRCQTLADGTKHCIVDGGASTIWVRLPSGELRKITNFEDFANDPEALKGIRAFLSTYSHPQARPYLPEQATIFIKPVGGINEDNVQDWPLDQRWLTPPREHSGCWSHIVTGSERDVLLAATSRNMGYFSFRDDKQMYHTILVPHIPGVEFRDTRYHYCLPAVPAPGTTPSSP